ncbi:hypothetical protein OAE79_03035, partial [Rhodopirellula sp.]
APTPCDGGENAWWCWRETNAVKAVEVTPGRFIVLPRHSGILFPPSNSQKSAIEEVLASDITKTARDVLAR